MTAAVVAPLPIASSPDLIVSSADPTAEARKRRREILATHRFVLDDAGLEDDRAFKKFKSDVDSDTSSVSSKTKAKKPQMKYDPDVPMSKEEAAAWRREQRRKRNRESAAASRQRQRDRIVELEGEVEVWKAKYEDVLARIHELESVVGCVTELPERTSTPEPMLLTVTPRASPLVSSALLSTGEDLDDIDIKDDGEEEPLPSKMISRPA